MKLTIISGRSGAGKSVALSVLEDLGYYCIDNLPLELLQHWLQQANKHEHVAISLDMRNLPKELFKIEMVLTEIKKHIETQIIFLDASDSKLLKRYSETRRRHPLSSKSASLAEAIKCETNWLEPVKNSADKIIDTTQLNLYELSAAIRKQINGSEKNRLTLTFESFGFKHGAPAEADFIFDVRFLPNPYWQPQLREYSGLDKPVQDFFAKQPEVTQVLNQLQALFQSWLPQFEQNNRSYVTVAIGCTGGRHRSVYIASKLAEFFSKDKEVQLSHKNLKS